MMSEEEKIKHLLTRNVEDVIERGHLENALRSGKKLRVKHGVDPTGPKIHLGRAVVLWKLREFQELGHKVILIIGDFTAQIGDASDKLDKRPMLTKKEIEKNLRGYLDQIGEIIDVKDKKKIEVRYNSEWLGELDFAEISRLAEAFTVQQMIERRNFRERIAAHKEISLRELLYPIMQGYDSFAIEADVELGGTDQLFNLLAGRKIQEHYGKKPQDIMTTKMLIGTDGRKMSTSWGNVVNISDPPEEQYGKMMTVHDDLVLEYFELAADVPGNRKELKKAKGSGLKDLKADLAFEVVRRYHGEKAAEKAAKNFEKLFSKKDTSSADIPNLQVREKSISLLDLVVRTGVPKSKSDARRLILQGAVRIGDEVMHDGEEAVSLKGGEVLRVGKKSFFRIVR